MSTQVSSTADMTTDMTVDSEAASFASNITGSLVWSYIIVFVLILCCSDSTSCFPVAHPHMEPFASQHATNSICVSFSPMFVTP